MNGIEIRSVSASEVWSLRDLCLSIPPLTSYPHYPRDHDPATIHMAAISNEQIVGCLTLMPDVHQAFYQKDPIRLRGMAVHPKYRRTAIGTQLIQFMSRTLRERSQSFLWCHARIAAVPFYAAQGFQSMGEVYNIEGIGPHRLMYLNIY